MKFNTKRDEDYSDLEVVRGANSVIVPDESLFEAEKNFWFFDLVQVASWHQGHYAFFKRGMLREFIKKGLIQVYVCSKLKIPIFKIHSNYEQFFQNCLDERNKFIRLKKDRGL